MIGGFAIWMTRVVGALAVSGMPRSCTTTTIARRGGRCGGDQVCEPTILLLGSLWLLVLLCHGRDAGDISPLLLPGFSMVQPLPQSMGGSQILRCCCCYCPNYYLPGCGMGGGGRQPSTPLPLPPLGIWTQPQEPESQGWGLYPCPSSASIKHAGIPTFRCHCVALSSVPVYQAEQPLCWVINVLQVVD